MSDKEVLENILKGAEEMGCLKCAIWNEAAKCFGKRGMCEECFKMYHGDPHQDISNLGMPLLIEWRSKEELLEMYPA